MDNQGTDIVGEFGVIGLCALLLFPCILGFMWWLGCFEDSPEQGKKNI